MNHTSAWFMAARRNSDDGGSFGKQKRATPFCADSGRVQTSPQTQSRCPVVYLSSQAGSAVLRSFFIPTSTERIVPGTDGAPRSCPGTGVRPRTLFFGMSRRPIRADAPSGCPCTVRRALHRSARLILLYGEIGCKSDHSPQQLLQ